MFHSTFNCWIYHKEYHSLIVCGSMDGKTYLLLIDLSQAACPPVLASSTYSVSPTESATIFCHCDAQEMHPFAIRKTCPDVE